VVTNQREIAADDFFDGMFATALEEGEIITAVRFAPPKRGGYAKFRTRPRATRWSGSTWPTPPSGVRVAVTGAGENGVFRHDGLEAALSRTSRRKPLTA
jgi:aerobic carbon-monoxide dehydrogenase medium subunit